MRAVLEFLLGLLEFVLSMALFIATGIGVMVFIAWFTGVVFQWIGTLLV